MYDWLDDALRENAQLVTANRRLARVLQDVYARQQVAAGQLAWKTPQILEWKDWAAGLLTTFAEHSEVPLVISPQQSKILWERCLRREINDPLLNIGQLAKLSRDAWNRLREWNVPMSACEQSVRNRDQRLFAVAAASYQSILTRESWVDEVGMIELAIELLGSGRCSNVTTLTLAGFDRVSPLLQGLLDAYATADGTIVFIDHKQRRLGTKQAQLCTAEHADAELRSAGTWAGDRLREAPHASIGIVVSQLEQDAQRSLRLVKEGLLPGWQNAGPSINSLVNVSYGKKLSEYPVIATALMALRWLQTDLSSSDVSALLRASVIGDARNHHRVRAELRLRNFPDQRWTASQLLEFLSREASHSDGLEFVARIAEQRDQLPVRMAPGAWVELFSEVLEKISWPGVDSLSSDEFQTINRWRELLNEVARLELVIESMTVAEALARVSVIASETIFQPENKTHNVQVLGPLEAAGLDFDYLWISGASSTNWPAQGRPLSLVSRDLQREYKLPDSTPADSLAYASRVLQRLAASGGDVVFSYSQAQNDAQQTASELLGELVTSANNTATDPGWNAACLTDRVRPVRTKQDPVPALAEHESLSGGAGSIQRQFVEPFAAFVTGRLGLLSLWPIEPGLTPGIRGSLIHDAAQQIYADCPPNAEIQQWDEAEIRTRSSAAVSKAFRFAELNADTTLRKILGLEKRRVQQLMYGVVAADASRDTFKIAAVEKDIEATIAGLRLRVRIDRLDLDQQGQQIIIDYKTGATKRLLGRDKMPGDMQLVVYACALPGAVSGIALFNIDSRNISLDAAGRDFSPALDWDTALSEWIAQVEVAAGEIAAGDVRLNVSQSIQQSRALGLLSRVRELQHAR
ncbi:MAG: PD-(D/E)XK nuclease family protein [Woeseiaceae bacterium]